MVYIHRWAEFQSAAEELYERAPDRTRNCVKWKPSEGKLVLKITDDITCLKYRTHSSIFLNRFEALNLSLMQKMQNVKSTQTVGGGSGSGSVAGPSAAAGGIKVEEEQEQKPGRVVESGPGGVRGISGSGVQGGGVNKKKKGKKKK